MHSNSSYIEFSECNQWKNFCVLIIGNVAKKGAKVNLDWTFLIPIISASTIDRGGERDWKRRTCNIKVARFAVNSF